MFQLDYGEAENVSEPHSKNETVLVSYEQDIFYSRDGFSIVWFSFQQKYIYKKKHKKGNKTKKQTKKKNSFLIATFIDLFQEIVSRVDQNKRKNF
jgi:hypothetical protein